MISMLWAMFQANFPSTDAQSVYQMKFLVLPPERLDQARAMVPPLTPGACCGFTNSYQTICDWMGATPVAEINWDIDNLYPRCGCKDFDFNAGRKESLSIPDIKPLMYTLQNNNWFTSLTVKDFQLKESISCIANVLRVNKFINKLVLSGCGLTKENIDVVVEGLVNNKLYPLTHLDLSNNMLEDRGFASIASALSQMRAIHTLDLGNCSGGKVGSATVLDAISANVPLVTGLKSFNFSNNMLGSEGSTALAKLIGAATSLHTLNISGCAAAFDILKLSKSYSVRDLDVSNHHITTSKMDTCSKLAGFLKGLEKLETLSLSKCQINMEAVQVLTAPDSKLMSITSLNLNDNDLSDDGIVRLCEAISTHPSLTTLSISRNFSRRTRLRSKMIVSLVQLIESDCPLISLEIEGNARNALKTEVLPLLFSMMTNKSITHLNISGHGIGDDCAATFFRVLQTNNVLRSLQWDDNHTTLQGFQYFLNGISKNTTLSVMPLPVVDVSREVLRLDKQPSYQTLLDVLSDISKHISKNVSTPPSAVDLTNQFLPPPLPLLHDGRAQTASPAPTVSSPPLSEATASSTGTCTTPRPSHLLPKNRPSRS
ncbi:myosin-I binding protein [Pelomyxa schiedti]|nr:myosin-I binding protein [Pelomyxa schiedti]